MTHKIVKTDFFDRNSVIVARDLIGKYLVREKDGKAYPFMIVETEAYEGLRDMASHAHRGQTLRNTPMWGEPGTIYVYFTYGMHWMLNITCGKVGHPAAVLIRGVEGTTGPARLTKMLGIDKMLNGKILGKSSGLWIETRDADSRKIKQKIKPGIKARIKARIKIAKTPRIGIAYAGPIWSQKLYRFIIKQ